MVEEQKRALLEIVETCYGGPDCIAPVEFLFASRNWMNFTIVHPEETTAKFKLLAHCIKSNFDKLPEEALFKQLLASDYTIDMAPILAKIKSPAWDKCDKCVPLAVDRFDQFDRRGYSDYYEQLLELHQEYLQATSDDVDTLHCACFSLNNAVFKCKYDPGIYNWDDYPTRVADIKTMMDEYWDDNPDMTFMVIEYWDGEAKKMARYAKTSTTRMAEAEVPKFALLAYVLEGRDLKRFSQYVSNNTELLEYIKKVSD